MTTTNLRRLTAVFVLSALAWACLSLMQQPAETAADLPSERAVAALVSTDGAAAARAIPASFAAERGYQPVIESGALVNPSGDCSSPIPLPKDFDLACRRHDLGYDLLRHAARTGGALPTDARRSIDDRFGRDTQRLCEQRPNSVARTTCSGFSTVATAAVRFNSWRQHWSTPSRENGLTIGTDALGVIVLGSGAGVLGLTAGLMRRRLNQLSSTTSAARIQGIRA